MTERNADGLRYSVLRKSDPDLTDVVMDTVGDIIGVSKRFLETVWSDMTNLQLQLYGQADFHKRVKRKHESYKEQYLERF